MGARVYVAAAAAAFLLGGCATTTKAPVCSAASGNAVDLHGRLAVKYTQNSEPKSMTVNYSWSQTPQCTNVALSTPIGSTIATIEVTPEQAVLTESGKPPRSAPDIDTLTARILGWSLPVAGLREWMQGYATAADGKRFNASPSNTDVTTKDGWRLSFVSWQDGSNPPKPKRIDAERSASGQIDEVSLRIVIDAE